MARNALLCVFKGLTGGASLMLLFGVHNESFDAKCLWLLPALQVWCDVCSQQPRVASIELMS